MACLHNEAIKSHFHQELENLPRRDRSFYATFQREENCSGATGRVQTCHASAQEHVVVASLGVAGPPASGWAERHTRRLAIFPEPALLCHNSGPHLPVRQIPTHVLRLSSFVKLPKKS